MRSKLFFAFLLFFCSTMFAQTSQFGFVRTLQKLDKPAEYLAGVRITTLESPNAIFSQKGDGSFEIPINTDDNQSGYTILDVYMKDYHLVDYDILNKGRSFSSSPLEIVLINKNDEEKLFKEKTKLLWFTLKREYNDQFAKIKKTDVESRRRLDNEYRVALRQMNPMVNRMIYTDYKKLTDSLDMEIAYAYENGDLSLAYQLLNRKPPFAGHSDEEIASYMSDCDKKIDYFISVFRSDSVLFYKKHKIEIDPKNTLLYLNEIGDYYELLSQYDSALYYYQAALNYVQSRHGENHTDVATCYTNMGNIYSTLCDFEKAIEYHQKALQIRLFLFGLNHPYVAESYSDVGYDFKSIGECDSALTYYTNAQNINMRLFGDSHPNTAYSYLYVGWIYQIRNKYVYSQSEIQENLNTALEYSQKALKIMKNHYGDNHPKTALCYNQLSYVYYYLGNDELALQYAKQALAIDQTYYGKFHPFLAEDYFTLGVVCDAMGEYQNAVNSYLKALELYRLIKPENSPVLADLNTNLGISYNIQNEYDKALSYLNDALIIYQSAYGERHQKVGDCFNNLGSVCYNQGNDVKALEYFLMDLDIKDSTYGPMHSRVASCLLDIGDVYYSSSQYDKALVYYIRAFDIYDSFNIIDNKRIECCQKIGRSYYYSYSFDDALKYYLIEKELILLSRGNNNSKYAYLCILIGGVYNVLGLYDKTLDYYNEALSYYESEYGAQSKEAKELRKAIKKLPGVRQ